MEAVTKTNHTQPAFGQLESHFTPINMCGLLKLSILLLLIAHCVFALKCFQCSNNENEPGKRCNVNETRYTESTDTTVSHACRIWAKNGVAVHKTMVVNTSCTNETLKNDIDNLVPKFAGESPSQAYCCNWNLCNYNTTLAQLAEEPSNAAENLAPGTQSLSINLSAFTYVILSSQILQLLY